MRWFVGSIRVAWSYLLIAPSTLTLTSLSPWVARRTASCRFRLQPSPSRLETTREAASATLPSFIRELTFLDGRSAIPRTRHPAASNHTRLHPISSQNGAREDDRGAARIGGPKC